VSRFSRLWRFTFWQCWDRESRSRQIEISWSGSRYLNCRDKDFESVEIFSTVEIYFLIVLRSRVSIETQSRKLDLDRYISTVETKILKVLRFSRLSRLTFWQCWDRESWSSHNRENLIWMEISQLSRQRFWKFRDFFDCGDLIFDSVEIESLDQDTIETNRDPQA
jgi:hypothetical protein